MVNFKDAFFIIEAECRWSQGDINQLLIQMFCLQHKRNRSGKKTVVYDTCATVTLVTWNLDRLGLSLRTSLMTLSTVEGVPEVR